MNGIKLVELRIMELKDKYAGISITLNAGGISRRKKDSLYHQKGVVMGMLNFNRRLLKNATCTGH